MRYGDTINERAVRILLECILVIIILKAFLHGEEKGYFPSTQVLTLDTSCTSDLSDFNPLACGLIFEYIMKYAKRVSQIKQGSEQIPINPMID